MLDIASMEVAVWVPPLVAFVISFFTCMGGVSGAFLLLPFQMSVLGFTAPAVSATNHLYNAASIPAGVYRYWREGRMVWPVTWIVVAGTLPGVFLGAFIRVRWLPDPESFKLFAAGVMAYIGARMIRDLARGPTDSAAAAFHRQARAGAPGPGAERSRSGAVPDPSPVGSVELSWTRLRYTFLDEPHEVRVRPLVLLTFVVGLVGGVYGVGGGAIIAPLLVSFYGLPVHTIAGPVLMATFVTSVAGVGAFQALAPLYPELAIAPSWTLGLLFGLGGMAGMYLGARAQRRVPARAIKWLLAAILVLTAGRYALDAWGG